MRNGPQPQNEPRSALIIRRTHEAMHSTSGNVFKFATAVAEHYAQMIKPADRIIEFYPCVGTIAAALKAQKNNWNIIDQIIRGTRRFPVDLEEAWVAALPDPHRDNLVRELASRYGLTGTRAPARSAHEHVACLADVMTDAGDTARALAPLLGTLGYGDRERLQASVRVIARMRDDVGSLLEQLNQQLGLIDSNVATIRKG